MNSTTNIDLIWIGGHNCRVVGLPFVDRVHTWFDFDGVISDTDASKVAACRELTGRDISACLLDSTRLGEAGLTKAEYEQIQDMVYKNPDGPVLVPMLGAIEAIKLLIDEGKMPGILTARYGEPEVMKIIRFMEETGTELPIIGVGYEASKNGAKASVLEAVRAFNYFDDDVKMVNAILGMGKPSHDLYLFDPSGTQDVPEGAKSVHNWTEILEAILPQHEEER